MKKFEFTDEKLVTEDGRMLRRIRATRDFGTIKKGDVGGFLEKESNLSHTGYSWVSGWATVSGRSEVSEDAVVSEHADISGAARIFGNARVFGWACIRDEARISGSAKVSGYTLAGWGVKVDGRACICGDAIVRGNIIVTEKATISGEAIIEGNGIVFGGKARITQKEDFLHVCGALPEITFYKEQDGIAVHGLSFSGSLDQFRLHVKNMFGNTFSGRRILEFCDTAKRIL